MECLRPALMGTIYRNQRDDVPHCVHLPNGRSYGQQFAAVRIRTVDHQPRHDSSCCPIPGLMAVTSYYDVFLLSDGGSAWRSQ
jgi:hypothetical protein